MELQSAVEEPLTAAALHSDGANIDENIKDSTKNNRFEVTLSVSTSEVRSKAEGGKITAFDTIKIDTNDEELVREILTSRNYSTNQWNGTCSNQNYVGMTGVILDFDGTLTIDEARDLFYGYHYILHTSASHQVKEPKGDRFRVILPFAPRGLQFTSPAECKQVYSKLLALYPQADAACADPARKYFPHTNELGAEFILEVNNTGRYFDIDISDVPDQAQTSQPHLAYLPPEELNTREELERMLKFDRFIPWCQEHAVDGLPEPLWHAMISNLCRFIGGKELIHQISSLDPVSGRYDFDATEDKIQHALESSGPMGYAEIVRRGWPGIVPSSPLAPAGWAKLGHITNREPLSRGKHASQDIHIRYDDQLIAEIAGSWQITDLVTLKNGLLRDETKVRIVCPFCDSDTAVMRSNTFHFTYLHCDHCDKTYYEHPDAPGLFSYNGELLRVEMNSNRFISYERLKGVNFRTAEEWQYANQVVMNDPKRRFLGDSFQIRRIGSADYPVLDFELSVQDNAVLFKFPAIPTQATDNDMIDSFIEGMFREYAGFIKDWMALYSYTNYQSLPVIVLTGARSCGKNTFADLVGEIFPTLMGHWDGDKEQFNDFAVKKLVFIDENKNSDKPTQYTEIKKLTGNRITRVNEKHKPAYYAPNNVKLIIATNDPRPIAVKWREEPKSENTNNFFLYSCPPLPPEEVDPALFEKLRARLGYYVRTELKDRYQRMARGGPKHYRYALATPITEFAKNLFGSSKTLIESEAEELAQYLVCGINQMNLSQTRPSAIQFKPKDVDGGLYVLQQDIRDLVDQLRFKGNTNYKAYVTVLQDQGVISYKNDHRVSNQRLGYQILRSPDYYTTTASGVLPVDSEQGSSSVNRPKCAVLECPTTPRNQSIFE
jgi:hypothetical protein